MKNNKPFKPSKELTEFDWELLKKEQKEIEEYFKRRTLGTIPLEVRVKDLEILVAKIQQQLQECLKYIEYQKEVDAGDDW